MLKALRASAHLIFAAILRAKYHYYFLHFADEEIRSGDVKRTAQGHSRTWSQDAKSGVWEAEGPPSSHRTNHLSVDGSPNWVCMLTRVITALSKFWKDAHPGTNAYL